MGDRYFEVLESVQDDVIHVTTPYLRGSRPRYLDPVGRTLCVSPTLAHPHGEQDLGEELTLRA